MTFEEAFDELNTQNIAGVAAEMLDWHPCILGNMLLAVQLAKSRRYPLSHPGYSGPLATCAGLETTMPNKEIANQAKFAKGLLKLAGKILDKELQSAERISVGGMVE